MDCNFGIKAEEDCLSFTKIKTEPQDTKSEIKTEAEGHDIKEETFPIWDLDASTRTQLEIEKKKCLNKFFEDVTSSVGVACDNHLVEEKCDMCLSNHTGKNSAQSNPMLFSKSAGKHFKCNICCKSFSSKHCVSAHVYLHTNEKRFTCNLCCKSFFNKSSLVIHTRKHNKEKPLTCDICKKQFFQRYDLSIHSRTHTFEKPFKCNICNKLFSQKSNLATHIRIHNDDKPFKCNNCNRSFSRKSHLITHSQIHDNKNP